MKSGDLVGGHVDRGVTAPPGTDAGQHGGQPGPPLEVRLLHLPADDRAALQHGLLADEPAAAHGERAARRWRGRATAYRPRPIGTPSTVSARPATSTHHQPAVAVATTPAAVTSSPPARARTIRRRRAAGGCAVSGPGSSTSRRPSAQASARGPSGSSWPRRAASPRPVTRALSRAARTQPHAEALRQRPAADPVDLQLGVPAGDQPAGGDQRAAPAGQPEAPVHHRGADHRARDEQDQGDDRARAAAARPSERSGPSRSGRNRRGQLVDQPEQRADRGQGHREVAADQRGVEQPAVVEAGELLLRRLGCRFAVPGRCRGGPVGEDGGPQPVALRAGHAVDDELLAVARDRAGRGVDAHPHQAEDAVQRRRLHLHARGSGRWARCAPSGRPARG